MIIGIDFDRVLFDTESFKDDISDDIPGFLDHYRKNRSRYQTKPAAKDIPVQLSVLESALQNLESYLIEDVQALADSEHVFVIVSRGPQWFQRQKITNSNITTYIPRYIIVDTEPKDMANIDLLIDDSMDELNRISIPSFHFERHKHSVRSILSLLDTNDNKE